MPLYASVYMCLVVTCWESADLWALVCGVLLWVCYFPIGILGQARYIIVSIPDLCTLNYYDKSWTSGYLNLPNDQPSNFSDMYWLDPLRLKPQLVDVIIAHDAKNRAHSDKQKQKRVFTPRRHQIPRTNLQHTIIV